MPLRGARSAAPRALPGAGIGRCAGPARPSASRHCMELSLREAVLWERFGKVSSLGTVPVPVLKWRVILVIGDHPPLQVNA